jgi:long-chain acyl-CoA synthetase
LRTFEPSKLLEWIDDKKPNALLLVPTMLRRVIHDPTIDRYDCSSLRKIIYGGSPMPMEVLIKAQEKWPHAEFIQGYGMTEASLLVTVLMGRDHKPKGTEKERKRLYSCGQPIVGVEAKIINDAGQEAAVGEVGEIVVRGPNVMKGYWRRPQDTKEVLKGGWYHTGDLAYRDEEHYFYIVRAGKVRAGKPSPLGLG